MTHKPTTIALAGNPNVGKSTVFNALTGMNQHTGNWPGKTVTKAEGLCHTPKQDYTLVDLPGTYSLMAHSTEEEVARNFICFDNPDAVVVVCDATCLERNLNLVLQTMEITRNVILCVNLMDEAKRKHITINLPQLAKRLGVPVVGVVARHPKTLKHLVAHFDKCNANDDSSNPPPLLYTTIVEHAIGMIEPHLIALTNETRKRRFLSVHLLDTDDALLQEIQNYLGINIEEQTELINAIHNARQYLCDRGIDANRLKDILVSTIVAKAEEICQGTVTCWHSANPGLDRRLDHVLTSRALGYPIMLCLLAFVFWLTIVGANYPSELLSRGLFWLQDQLTALFHYFHAPSWLHGALVLGVYRVLAWVVSVMLPPMAIFFPLFTLLEDAGYLPRIAYNLDHTFKRCHACGKQALTMCMGFGCNAAGVIGCRIIDSPRERLLAILTNNFVPCNGRFPILIAILTMFFVGCSGGLSASLWSALLLTFVILLGIGVTFAITRLLSQTLLKGVPSSFTLELPPYRRPQVAKVFVRSIFDRTLFVLGRAVIVAAPAGLVLWLMANITVNDASLLNTCASFLDPFAKLMGLDGVILIAFILGFPANEIVIPIIIMAYMAQGSILELDSLAAMKQLFVSHGWTWVTATSTMLFSLMHWPCSTTLLTIKKETASWRWTLLAVTIPTSIGILICILFTTIARLFL